MSRSGARPRVAAPGKTRRGSPSALVLLSGGLDSAACVAFYRAQGLGLASMFFDYGQPAAVQERRASRRIAAHFGIEHHVVNLRGGLPKAPGEVRARNAVFMLAALMEYPMQKGLIVLGIHAGTPYYDCTPAFLVNIQSLFDGYTNGRVQAAAPFIGMNKREVWQYGQNTGLPVALTYSCQCGGKKPCGKCASCRDRIKLDALSHH